MQAKTSGEVQTFSGNKQHHRMLYRKANTVQPRTGIYTVENDKKRRFRNLKNFLKALQQFLSFPTGPGYQDPPQKCNPNFV